jgi:hypothetical protein
MDNKHELIATLEKRQRTSAILSLLTIVAVIGIAVIFFMLQSTMTQLREREAELIENENLLTAIRDQKAVSDMMLNRATDLLDSIKNIHPGLAPHINAVMLADLQVPILEVSEAEAEEPDEGTDDVQVVTMAAKDDIEPDPAHLPKSTAVKSSRPSPKESRPGSDAKELATARPATAFPSEQKGRQVSEMRARVERSTFIITLHSVGAGVPDRDAVITALNAQGYAVHPGHDFSKDQRPNWMAAQPTLFYYHDASLTEAEAMADILYNSTGVKYDVSRGSGLGVMKGQERNTFFIHLIR